MAAYAVVADLATVLPLAAYESVPVATRQAILDAACGYADDKMRARYRLPLGLPYPASLTRAVLDIAAYNIMCVRGFNPAAGADINVRQKYADAMKYFDDVERQRTHPVVVESAAPGAVEYDGPLVISDPRQGWEPGTGGDDPSNMMPSWSRPLRGW